MEIENVVDLRTLHGRTINRPPNEKKVTKEKRAKTMATGAKLVTGRVETYERLASIADANAGIRIAQILS